MSVGGARNSCSPVSHAKLVCEDALNAGVSARAAAFMPAPDHFAGAGIQEMRWSTVGPLCARSHTNHA